MRRDKELRKPLDNLPNKVLAAEYQTVLPQKNLIAEELERSAGNWKNNQVREHFLQTARRMTADQAAALFGLRYRSCRCRLCRAFLFLPRSELFA
jgi:hypothetical protein